MATQIDYSQLSKLWKIAAATFLTLQAAANVVITEVTKNSSGVATRQEYSDGRSAQSGSSVIGSGAWKGIVDPVKQRAGVGTGAPDTTLEVVGTASGRVLHAQDQLRSSGSLLVQNAV